MKRHLITIAMFAILCFGQACKKDSDFLDRQPTDRFSVDAVWEDENLVLSLVGDFYDRYPDYQMIERWADYTAFDEAFASANGEYGRHQNTEYNYDSWAYWDYTFIREINLFLQRGSEPTNTLAPEDTERFMAEARFIRAGVYFELVKRMGGVPLILEPLTYDYGGDPTPLQRPRAKESEIYDFVISECEEIKDMLPDNAADPSRASKAAALAMEARAALYAGSIAKYGSSVTPGVSLPGGEVGIPASMASGYYRAALEAAEEIINGGQYSLYNKNADLAENFAALFTDKSNPEVIFVRDYKLKTKKAHGFTIDNQPRSIAEEQQGGRLNPSLNLVQSFEKLDNTFASLPTTSGGSPIFYDNPTDIFAGRDARLAGTVMLPGTQFKGKPIDIWAGYQLADGSIVTGTTFAERKTDVLPGVSGSVQVVGGDGPIDGLEFSAQTGFYVRKYLDPATGSGQIGTRSEVWWIRYRYGEVLLNAAEAAFELGNTSTAANYMKLVRDRAGLTNALTPGQITFDRIVHERRVELAFEDHQLWDMKRWRLAHRVWNGNPNTAADFTNATNIGSATRQSTMVFGLWPYKYHEPGDSNDGKYIFKVVKPSRVTAAHRFRLGNYYSQISQDILNGNPLIVRNPNQ